MHFGVSQKKVCFQDANSISGCRPKRDLVVFKRNANRTVTLKSCLTSTSLYVISLVFVVSTTTDKQQLLHLYPEIPDKKLCLLPKPLKLKLKDTIVLIAYSPRSFLKYKVYGSAPDAVNFECVVSVGHITFLPTTCSALEIF